MIGLFGCAAAVVGGLRPAEDRLHRGMVSLGESDYRAAYDDLAWVLATCPATEPGDRALLGLLALELDPRNNAGRPAAAAELAARRLAVGGGGWVAPVVETFYLLALEIGAPAVERAPVGVPSPSMSEPDPDPASRGFHFASTSRQVADQVADCPPAEAIGAPRAAPRHPGTPLAARVAAGRLERNQLADRIGQLERELTEARRTVGQREADLARLEQELERIRRTLRP